MCKMSILEGPIIVPYTAGGLGDYETRRRKSLRHYSNPIRLATPSPTIAAIPRLHCSAGLPDKIKFISHLQSYLINSFLIQ